MVSRTELYDKRPCNRRRVLMVRSLPGDACLNAQEVSTYKDLTLGRGNFEVSCDLTVPMPELKREPSCQLFYWNILRHDRQTDLSISLSLSVTNGMPNELCRNAFVSGGGVNGHSEFR